MAKLFFHSQTVILSDELTPSLHSTSPVSPYSPPVAALVGSVLGEALQSLPFLVFELPLWHHRLNGHESVQTLGNSEGLGSRASCSPRGRKESDTAERLNNSNTAS